MEELSDAKRPMKLVQALNLVGKEYPRILKVLKENLRKNGGLYSDQTKLFLTKEAQTAKITGWLDQAESLFNQREILIERIHATNLETRLSIKIGDVTKEKSLDAWILWKNTLGTDAAETYSQLMEPSPEKEVRTRMNEETKKAEAIQFERYWDAEKKEKKMNYFLSLHNTIDSALEVKNAETDLIPLE